MSKGLGRRRLDTWKGFLFWKRTDSAGMRKSLLRCEKWSKDQHCSEFASDCELENEDSLKFHIATGFEEANRSICFKKNI